MKTYTIGLAIFCSLIIFANAQAVDVRTNGPVIDVPTRVEHDADINAARSYIDATRDTLRALMDALSGRVTTLEDGTPPTDPVPNPDPAPEPEPEPLPPVGLYDSIDDCVAAMTPGVWTNCGVAPMPLLTREEVRAAGGDDGNNGPRCVLDAWTDGAWDGETMYFHGGGHFCYAGSEWYAFDVPTLTWRRLNMTGPFSFAGPQRLDFTRTNNDGTTIFYEAGSRFVPFAYPSNWSAMPEGG